MIEGPPLASHVRVVGPVPVGVVTLVVVLERLLEVDVVDCEVDVLDVDMLVVVVELL